MIRESTGSYLSLVWLGRGWIGWCNSSGEGWKRRAPPPSASWAKNILNTEHNQNSGDLVSWGDSESVDV